MQSFAALRRDTSLAGVDTGREVTGVACFAVICPTVTLFLRLYVRIAIQKRLGKDDYLAIASLFVLSALCALLIRSCHYYSIDALLTSLSSSSLVELARITFVCEILYILTTALTKLSIGFYFLRLTRKAYQIQVICATAAIVVLFSILYLFFIILQCQPANYFWRQYKQTHTTGNCRSRRSMADITYTHAAMSCLTDWIYGLIPILILWKLDLKFKTKLSVVLVLSLGVVASIATIVRIVDIHTLKSMTSFSWECIRLIKWSIIEPAIALTAANIATLRPFFQSLVSKNPRPPKLSINAVRGLSRKSSACYKSEFAEMLGLAVSPGVKTHVYAESSLDPINQKSPIWSRWRDSEFGPPSPRSPIWPGYGETESKPDTRYQHGPEREGRTVSLGLGSIKSGRWVAKTQPNIGIMKTTVVTRESGLRTDKTEN